MMMQAIKVSNNVRQMAYVASNSATVRSFGSKLSWNPSLKKSTTVTEKRRSVSVSRRHSNGQVRALFGGGSATTNAPQSLYDVKANTIDGKEMSMADLKGKVVLFVNVASACGTLADELCWIWVVVVYFRFDVSKIDWCCIKKTRSSGMCMIIVT